MKKIIEWITCKDAREERKKKKEEVENEHVDSQPISVCRVMKILTNNIINLEYSTTKYSRVIIILTVVLAILTVMMVFKGGS